MLLSNKSVVFTLLLLKSSKSVVFILRSSKSVVFILMPSLLICTSANAEAHNRCPSHVEGHNASNTVSIVFFVAYHIADRRLLLGVTPAHQTNLLFYKKEALNLSDGRGMRIKDFSIAET